MFWLSRPPYLRWIAGGLLIVGSLVVEFRPSRTVPHPFAAVAIDTGEEISTGDVSWKQVPKGLLPAVRLPVIASHRLEPGEPVLPSAAADGSDVPEGWLALELPVPGVAVPGQPVKVVIAAPYEGDPSSTSGIVISRGSDDGFGQATAMVAIPAETASAVAVGLNEGRVIVLLGG